MEFYDIDQIKASGDCIRFVREVLGLEMRGDRCRAKWRGGDGYNVAVQKDKWYDHTEKQGGSIIDLCAVSQHDGDVARATEALGKWLCLQPQKGLRVIKSKRVVAEYVYCNKAGEPVHKTVRYEPKSFSQMSYVNGQWVSGLDGVETVPYMLDKWSSAGLVVICEGEKDVDRLATAGLDATSLPMGADKWCEHWTQYFADKDIVICRDNDDAGLQHAKRITWELRDTAKSIKIICPCTNKPKGDVSDFIESGGTIPELQQMIADTDAITDIQKPDSAERDELVERAKLANRTAYCNYAIVESSGEGKKKTYFTARRVIDMVEDLHTRLLGFPCRLGDQLFDRDRDTNIIRMIKNGIALRAWVSEKTGKQPLFKSKIDGIVNWDTLFESLFHNSKQYEGISYAPGWPKRQDIYYTHPHLPAPDKNHKYFNQLMDFFNHETNADALMLRCLFATPLYYRFGVDRPLWVIDSKKGRGVGKSTIAKKLSLLYDYSGQPESGGDMMTVDPKLLNKESGQAQLYKRVLSSSGRSKRIVLLDNVTGYFDSSLIASIVTFDKVSGMAPYGRGEESRRQDMTIVLTSNSATFDTDLIDRSVFVHMDRPVRSRDWDDKINNFIESHRLQIFADMLDILDKGADFDFRPTSRFARWEYEVLAPMCKSLDNYSTVWKANMERQKKSDGESQEADIIQDYIASKLRDICNADPQERIFWITGAVLRRWCGEAVPQYGGSTGRNTTHKLKNAINAGQLPMLDYSIEKFPWRGPQKSRGMMWNIERYKKVMAAKERPYVWIIREDKGQIISEHEIDYTENGNDNGEGFI